MGQAAGASAVIGAVASSGGGGLLPKNYVSWQTSGSTILTDSDPVVPALEALDHEGTACATLGGDSKTISIVKTGIFVVTLQAQASWTGAALAVLDYLEASLTFTTADGDALAGQPPTGAWVDQRAFDQSNAASAYFQLTTPPLALAAADSFLARVAATVTPAATVAPTFGTGQLVVAIEQLA
jgi:hypothetical protein